jgi:uncharacterized damage-inducible protein DinB
MSFADMLRALYAYNRWATERLLDVAAQLTPEQWRAPGSAGHGSVRDTLVHLIGTQRSWLAWWDGTLPADQAYHLRLDPDDYPDVAALRAAWGQVERATQAFVAGLSDADATRVFSNPLPDGRVFRLTLGQMMLHVANHGTQHRSEVAAMLTAFGHSPGDLDLLWFFRPFADAAARNAAPEG